LNDSLLMWGRLTVCGRLAIGLCCIAPAAERIPNPLQVNNLPHVVCENL
jgi:hypothetical protein